LIGAPVALVRPVPPCVTGQIPRWGGNARLDEPPAVGEPAPLREGPTMRGILDRIARSRQRFVRCFPRPDERACGGFDPRQSQRRGHALGNSASALTCISARSCNRAIVPTSQRARGLASAGGRNRG